MTGKTKLDHVVACCCAAVAVLAACPLAFSQTAPASSAENQKAGEPIPEAWAKLTPHQKSLLERMYNDWAYLAKYRDADAALPPAAPGETRVVFMGDSITEG